MFSPLMPGTNWYGQPGFELSAMHEQIGLQSELGVTQMAILFERTGRAHVPSLERQLELIAGFGDEVIAKAG